MLRRKITVQSSSASSHGGGAEMSEFVWMGAAAAAAVAEDYDDEYHAWLETVGSIEAAPQLLLPSSLQLSPRIKHFLAAGSAAAVSSALYNPLDCLRVRWQVLPHSANETLYEFGKEIVRTEGLVNGLWKPGVGANAAGMAISAALRFGYYETVRDYIVTQHHDMLTTTSSTHHVENKQYWHMVAAGLICGTAGYAVSTPFHLLKTRIQAEHGLVDYRTNRYVTGARVGQEPYVTEFFSGVMRIVQQEGGLASLYRGTLPLSSRGAWFTAGQMVGYDGLKTLARRNGFEDGTPLHVCSSLSASFFASLLSSPSDLVMAKYMSSRTQQMSVWDCVREIHHQLGMTGFWRGWPIFFLRLSPVMLTYSTLYEQLRKQLGLGYFR